ncbi:DMT family transporter [Gloeobacter morelensis]|uniref:DMT family transporter n=1 Tax=Gloeobacter morelensis MG652769 TaxID=2781736 RepID=A0ABY3PMB3_9CYAN|nr:DMT family transporter [Gloeobacter morelensis]UFP94791.1 DMT family transporter [Gloeobacter morelensis MG652769]
MSMHRSTGRWQLGLALALLTMFLWGILPIALSIALQAIDVYTLTWARFTAAGGLLLGLLAVRRRLPPLGKLTAASWGLLAAAAVFLGGNYWLYLEGLSLTTAANAQVLIQLAPVLLSLGALVIFKERYSPLQWTGMGVLVAGFALFFREQLQGLLSSPGAYLTGSTFVLAAATSWAIYALAQKQLLRVLPSAGIMLVLYGGCALLFTPFAQPAVLRGLDTLHTAALVFCAFNTLVAYGAFAEALEHWEASRVSAVLALTPLVTLGADWGFAQLWPGLIKPDVLTGLGVFGAVLVVTGSLAMALGNTGKR